MKSVFKSRWNTWGSLGSGPERFPKVLVLGSVAVGGASWEHKFRIPARSWDVVVQLTSSKQTCVNTSESTKQKDRQTNRQKDLNSLGAARGTEVQGEQS